MEILTEPNIEKTKKLIKETKRPLAVTGRDNHYNKKIIEYGNFDVLLSPETNAQDSNLRQVNSGLNPFIARTANKKGIAIGIDLDMVKKEPKERKGVFLSKIIQNIKICRKTGTKIGVKSKNKKEAFNFILSLGASTKQAKEALYF